MNQHQMRGKKNGKKIVAQKKCKKEKAKDDVA
jgi:hypothetical protein